MSGDVVVEVPVNGKTYTITHNDGATDTYRVKGTATRVQNAMGLTMLEGSVGALDEQPRYAWSSKSRYYHEITCPAVARISKTNLNTSVTPPPDKEPSDCAKERAARR